MSESTLLEACPFRCLSRVCAVGHSIFFQRSLLMRMGVILRGDVLCGPALQFCEVHVLCRGSQALVFKGNFWQPFSKAVRTRLSV